MDRKSQKSDSKSASFEDAEGDNDNFEDCNDQEPKGKFIHFLIILKMRQSIPRKK